MKELKKKKEREKRLPRELKLGFVANDRIWFANETAYGARVLFGFGTRKSGKVIGICLEIDAPYPGCGTRTG